MPIMPFGGETALFDRLASLIDRWVIQQKYFATRVERVKGRDGRITVVPSSERKFRMFVAGVGGESENCSDGMTAVLPSAEHQVMTLFKAVTDHVVKGKPVFKILPDVQRIGKLLVTYSNDLTLRADARNLVKALQGDAFESVTPITEETASPKTPSSRRNPVGRSGRRAGAGVGVSMEYNF